MVESLKFIADFPHVSIDWMRYHNNNGSRLFECSIVGDAMVVAATSSTGEFGIHNRLIGQRHVFKFSEIEEIGFYLQDNEGGGGRSLFIDFTFKGVGQVRMTIYKYTHEQAIDLVSKMFAIGAVQRGDIQYYKGIEDTVKESFMKSYEELGSKMDSEKSAFYVIFGAIVMFVVGLFVFLLKK